VSTQTTVSLALAGHEVVLSNPQKVLFPLLGLTKADLVAYYVRVEEALMRWLGGRPVMLQRFPDGPSGNSFFQKRVPTRRPGWLRTLEVATPNGTASEALVLADLAHVAWAVNLACLGFHAWAFRASDPDHPDELRVDLDPSEGVSLEMVKEAAKETRQLLQELAMDGLVKTSGGRGLHVLVRLEARWSAIEVRSAAVALARELARRRPDLISAAWWKEERGRRVFVDYNQNAPHKTLFGAWSVRARPNATVSCPFEWDELEGMDPEDLTVTTVPTRLKQLGDPWLASCSFSLEPLLDLARRDKATGLADLPWPPVYPKMPGEPTRVAPSRRRRQP